MADAGSYAICAYVVTILVQILGCCLAFNGYIICAILLCCVIPVSLLIAIVLKNEIRYEIYRTSKTEAYIWGGVEHFALCVMGALLVISCYSGYNVLAIKDPATTVRGIGVAQLGEAYKRNPKAHDVYLTDGYVQELWTGYHTQSTKNSVVHFSAAPIYKDFDSSALGGSPLAWAIGNEDGWFKTLKGTYCPGGGVCGFNHEVDTLSEGYILNDGYTRAAKEAAQKGGFKFESGLPAIFMVNPYESLHRSERYYNLFYHFLVVYVTCIVAGNADVLIGKMGDESEPLV